MPSSPDSFGAPEAERVGEQFTGSEEKTWRRAIQNTKAESADEREAEVCECIAIGVFSTCPEPGPAAGR